MEDATIMDKMFTLHQQQQQQLSWIKNYFRHQWSEAELEKVSLMIIFFPGRRCRRRRHGERKSPVIVVFFILNNLDVQFED